MRHFIVFITILALLGGLGAYLYWSQKSVEAEVIAAIENADIAGLEARIDFEALRAFLKEDLRTKKNDKSPVGSLYASAGPETTKIDAVVDYYIQPQNIAILYYLRESAAADIPVSAFVVARSYAPPYGFALTFGAPPEMVKDGARAIADRYKVKVVFRLRSFQWKVTELHAPLYMVPQFTYSQPAVDIYAPRRG